MLLATALLLFNHCFCSEITPESTTPINTLWNNPGELTPYTFHFKLSTEILSQPKLSITFPSQYQSGLGIGTCSASETFTGVTVPCSVSGRVVTFEFQSLKQTIYSLELKGVQNPSDTGGTGMFELRSWSHSTLVDKNLLFGSLGISGPPDSLEVSVQVEGANLANYSPKHKFSVEIPEYYSKGTWLRVVYPQSFQIPDQVECFVQEWQSWIDCAKYKETSYLHLTPNKAIFPGSYSIEAYGILNPSTSVSSSSVYFEVMRANTFTVLAKNSQVELPSVDPGPVSQTEVTADLLMQNAPAEYSISFVPYNYIPEGGSLSIEFPSEYNGALPNTCLAYSGLTPSNNYNLVTCTSSGNSVTFSNFKEVNQQYITVKVKVYNPSSSGETNKLTIATFTPSGDLIDKTLNAGSVTISSIQYSEGFSVNMLLPKADNPIGNYGPIDLFLHPRSPLSCGNTATYLDIELELPSSVEIQTGELYCTFGSIVAESCTYTTSPKKVSIRTPQKTQCCPLAIKITTVGTSPEGFRIPSTSYGEHTFKLKVFDNTGTQTEAAQYVYRTKPASFNTLDIDYLHHTRDNWNVIRLTLENSVEIPADGVLEFEFVTKDHSFPRDLGWNLLSFQTESFACIYSNTWPDDPASRIECQITAGTTDDSAFVRVKNFQSNVAAGTQRWVTLPKVKNAPYAGFTPKIHVRTKDSSNTVLEEGTYDLPALEEFNVSANSASVTSSSNSVDDSNVEVDVSLTMSSTLQDTGEVYIMFPLGYKWTFAPQGTGISNCVSNTLEGGTSKYTVFTHVKAAGVLYKQSPGDSVASPFQTCFEIEKQSLYDQTPQIEILVVADKEVKEHYLVTHAPISSSSLAATVTGVHEEIDAYNIGNTNLWTFIITTGQRITAGGSIQLHLPKTHFSSISSECYKVVTPGVSCRGENDYDSNYHRLVLWDFVTGDEYSAGGTLEVWFHATAGSSASDAILEVFTQDEDLNTDKKIESLQITITLADFPYPEFIQINNFTSPLVEAYKSTPSNTEYGPLKFYIKPNYYYPETTTLYNTKVKVTFPHKSGTRYFKVNPSGNLECRMKLRNDPREKGYMGRACSFNQGTPDIVEFYTPNELSIDPSNLYEIELTTVGTPDPSENGFEYPDTEGYYRFIVELNKNEGAQQEQAEPFIYVMENRMSNVYVTSEHIGAGLFNIMRFHFEVGNSLPESGHSTTPGRIWLEFPYDKSGSGAGWEHDLGTGLNDGDQIDCFRYSSQFSGIPNYLIGSDELKCYLKHGYDDYVRIEISHFDSIAANDVFDFYIAGIKNPSANIYDFSVQIRTVYEDLNDLVEPKWVTVSRKVNKYIDTTQSLVVTGGNTPGTAQLEYNRISDPTRFAPLVDPVTLSLNIENNQEVTASSETIWLKIPTSIKLPYNSEETITLQLVEGGGSSCSVTWPNFEIWPLLGFVKIKPCADIPAKTYPSDTPNQVKIHPVYLNSWPSGTIQYETYILTDRRASIEKTSTLNWDYYTPSGTCTVQRARTQGYGEYSAQETYYFRFSCSSEVPQNGEYVIMLPDEFSNGSIDDTSCVFGSDSDVKSIDLATCSALRNNALSIRGFNKVIPAGSLVDLKVSITNPPLGTLPNPHNAYWITIATYTTTSDSQGSYQLIDVAKEVDYCHLTSSASIAIRVPDLEQDNHYVFYQGLRPLVDPGIAPIVFELESSTKIDKETGYIIVSTQDSISIPNNGWIRCLWKIGTIEHLAHDCTFASGSPNQIKMYAPTNHDIPANTEYKVYITSLCSDGRYEGISFDDNLVRYRMDVGVYATGSSLTSKERRYLNQVAEPFRLMNIDANQWTENTFTRIVVSLGVNTTPIPASDTRIVIEFPTPLFADDLGLGVPDNSRIGCSGQDDMDSSIECYLALGTGSQNIPAKVVIKGYSALNSDSETYTVHLPKVHLPSTGGDDKQVDITAYALDISSGWPGTFIYFRQVKNAFRIKTNTPASSTASSAPTASDYTVSNTATYTFVVDCTLASGDYYVIKFPDKISISSAVNCASVTCYYYSIPNMLILHATGNINSVSVSPIDNPTEHLDPDEYLEFTGYHWSGKELLEVFDYPTLSNSFGAFTPLTASVTIPYKPGGNLYKDDYLEYYLSFTSGRTVPSAGRIKIALPSEYPDFPESACYNLYEGLKSDVKGQVTCSLSGKEAIIQDFEEIVEGDVGVFRLYVQHPSSALTTTSGIKVSTFETSDTSSGKELQGPVETSTFTITSTQAPSYYSVPRQYLKPVFVEKSQYAPLELDISGFGTFVKDKGFLKITLDSNFGSPAAGSELVCLWENKRTRCSYTSDVFTVFAPYDSNWSTYPAKITITTTNSDSVDQVGIQYPNSAGEYQIFVQGDIDDDGTFEKEAIDYVHVWPSSKLTSFSVEPSHHTAQGTNLFKFNIEPSTNIPQNGYVRVYFRTKDHWGHTMFSDDLGTGLSHGDYIPCQKEPGDAQLNPLVGNSVKCKLYHGNSHSGKPSVVEMTNFQAISGAFSFVVWGVKNPPNTLADAINVDFWALTMDDTYLDLDYFHLNHVFTIKDPIASDPGTPSSPNDEPTTSESVGSAITLSIPLMDNTKPIVASTIYLLEFPQSIPLAGVSSIVGATGKIYEVLNIMQVTGAPTGSAGSHPAISFTTNQIIPQQWSSPVIVCHQWENNLSVRDSNSYSGVASLSLPSFSSVSFSSPDKENQIARSTLDFTTSVEIPSGGLIEITYPDDYSIQGADCELTQVSTNFVCSISGNVAEISVLQSIPDSTALQVGIYLRAKADTSDTLKIKSFADSAKSIALEAHTLTLSSIDSSIKWPLLLSAQHQSILQQTAVAGEHSQIRFKFKSSLTVSGATNQFIRVTLSTAFASKSSNAKIYCTVDNDSVPCEEATSNKVFKVYANHQSSITANSWHELVIYTHSADSDENGFVQPSSTSNSIKVEVTDNSSTQTQTLDLPVPSSVLANLKVEPLHRTAGELNVLTFTFKTSKAVDFNSGDYFAVEFPLEDYQGNSLFQEDLLTGKVTGETIDCKGETTFSNAKCTLVKGYNTYKTPARIRIEDSGNHAAGTTFKVSIPKIANPASHGTSVNVNFRVYHADSSDLVKQEKTVEYAFVSLASSAATGSCSAPTLSSYNTGEGTITMSLDCCSSSDLVAKDSLIIEIPENYHMPSSLTRTGGFDSITTYQSARWVKLSTSSGESCNSGSVSINLATFTNPSVTVNANSITLKAYVVHNSEMIQTVTYSPITTKIEPSKTSTTVSISAWQLADSNIPDILTYAELSFSSTEDIPSGGTIQIQLTHSSGTLKSDSYYFGPIEGQSTGLGSYYTLSFSGSTYTIADFNTVSGGTDIKLKIPVNNPSDGGNLIVGVTIYDEYSRSLGTAQSTATASGTQYTVNDSISSFMRLNSLGGSRELSFDLHLNLGGSMPYNYLYVKFPFIEAIGSGCTDTSASISGDICESGSVTYCNSAAVTTSKEIRFGLATTLGPSTYKISFSGCNKLIMDVSKAGPTYYDVLFADSPGGSGVFHRSYIYMPSSTGSVSSWEQLSNNYDERSVLVANGYSGSGEGLMIEFEREINTPTWTTDLGTGVSNLESVRALVESSGTKKEKCFLRTSSYTYKSALFCAIGSGSSHDIYLPQLVNPGSPNGRLSVMTFSFSSSQLSGFSSQSFNFVSGPVSSSSGSISIDNSEVQASANWDFSSVFNSGSTVKVLITFENYLSQIDLSGVADSGRKVMPESRMILCTVGGSTSLTVPIKNPYHTGTFQLEVYSFESNSLTLAKTVSQTITAASMQSISLSSRSYDRKENQDSILDITLQLAKGALAGATIELVFGSSYFSNIDCSQCVTDLPNLDSANPVTFSVSSPGDKKLTLTSMGDISAGTYFINNLRAYYSQSGSTSVSADVYVSASKEIESGSQSLSITSASTDNYLVKLPRASLTSGYRILKASEFSELVFYYSPSVNVPLGTNNYIKVATTDWQKGTANYLCLIDGNVCACTRSSDEITITPHIALSSGTVYTVKISANNGEQDGLGLPSSDGSHTITVETYVSNSQKDFGELVIPIYPLFSTFSVEPNVSGFGDESLIEITLTLTTAISGANQGAVVVEFPLYNLDSGSSEYTNSLGTSNHQNTYYGCEIFSASGTKFYPRSQVECKIVVGYNYNNKNLQSTKLVVSLGASDSIASSSSIKIGVPGVILPSNYRGTDFVVYSREISVSGEEIKDYFVYMRAQVAHNDNTLSTVNKDFPSISSNSIRETTDYAFSLQPSESISTSDKLVFVYNPNYLSVSLSSGDASPGYSALYFYPKAGWIVYTPASGISNSSPTTITLSDLVNPPFVPSSSAHYTFEARHWASFTSAYKRGIWKFKYVFGQNIPSPAYSKGTITPSSSEFGCFNCGGSMTTILAEQEPMYKLTFDYNLDLDQGGIIEVVFPDSSEEYQSVSQECEASSAGFSSSSTVSCIKTASLTYRVSNFGTYTKNNDISILAKAKNPPKQHSPTSNFEINIYYDSGLSNIGKDTSKSFTVTGPSSVPQGTAKTHLLLTSDFVPARTGDYAPLRFTFKPLTSIPQNTGTVELTVPSGSFQKYSGTDLLCKFIDPTNNYKEHIAKDCTYSSDVYTLTAPVDTQISNTHNWIAEIFTFGKATNGLLYPSNGLVNLHGNLNNNQEFDIHYNVMPSAMTKAQVYGWSHTEGFQNIFEVKFETPVGTYTSGTRIEVEFSTEQFLADLGLGISDGQEVYCTSDLSIESGKTLKCTLHIGSSTSNLPYRPQKTLVRIHNQDSNTGYKYLKLFNIVNPSSADLHVSVKLKVFTVDAKLEEVTTKEEVIQHVIGTQTDQSSPDNEDSYLNTISDRTVYASTVNFDLDVNLASKTLKESDIIIWHFPKDLRDDFTVQESSSNNNQDIKALLTDGIIVSSPPSGDSYSGAKTFHFDNYDNPKYRPINNPLAKAYVIINKHLSKKVIYDQNSLNHELVSVTQTVHAGDSTNAGYKQGRIDFNFQFSTPVDMPAGSTIELEFPAGFTLDNYCQVTSTNLAASSGDWVPCQKSGTTFLITGYNSYTQNNQVKVRGWANLPNSVSQTLYIRYYWDYPSLLTSQASVSYSLNNVQAISSISMGPYIYTAPDIPVLATEISEMSFSLSIPLTLIKKLGYVKVEFPSASWAVSGTLVCVWESSGNSWQAHECTEASGKITVLAPEYNDITPAIWKVVIRGLQGTDFDGVLFPTNPYRYQINTYYCTDGTSSEVLISEEKTKVPYEYLTEQFAYTFNSIKDDFMLLEVSITPKDDYKKGTPVEPSKSYMTLHFPTKQNSLNYFSNDLGSGYLDKQEIPCNALQRMSNLKCGLAHGDNSKGTDTLIYLYNYAEDLNTNPNSFIIPKLFNPSDSDRIVSFSLEIWMDDSSNNWYLKVHKEFKYLYDTITKTVTATSITMNHNNQNAGQTGSVNFQMDLATNFVNNYDEKLLWELAESEPKWTQDLCTSSIHTCSNQLNSHYFVLHPGGSISDNDFITIQNVPNYDNPYYSQTWTVYAYKNYELQNKMTAAFSLPFDVPDPTGYLDIVWRNLNDDLPNPLVNRKDHYTFKFRFPETIPSDGHIEIRFPSTYTIENYCKVLHTLPGHKCQKINTYTAKCVYSSDLHPTMNEVQVSCKATNPSSSGIVSGFKVVGFDSSGTIIKNILSLDTFDIGSAHTELAESYIGWPERTRVKARIGKFADLWVWLKIQRSDVSFDYGNHISLELPLGVNLATGVLECTWHDQSNTVPAAPVKDDGSSLSTSNPLRVPITSQIGLNPGTLYTIHCYTRDATAGLESNSFEFSGDARYQSWYFKVGKSSKGESAKVLKEVYPESFSAIDLTLYSFTVGKWNIMDLSFSPTKDVVVGGGVVIEVPTHNELDQVFEEDLGLGLNPLETQKQIACSVQAGFGGPTGASSSVKCFMERGRTHSVNNPAVIRIYGHTSPITDGSTNKIRIAKFKNPPKKKSSILNENLVANFKVWTYKPQSSDYVEDMARQNLDTLWYKFKRSGQSVLKDSNPYIENPAPQPTTSISETFTEFSSPLNVQFSLQNSIDDSTGFIIFEFDDAFALPETGATIDCNTPNDCEVYSESQWVLWRTTSASSTSFTVALQNSGDNFKSANMESTSGYSFSVYVIDEGEWKEEHICTEIASFAGGTLGVTIANSFNSYHKETYDIWTISIDPEKDSSFTKRIDIYFPSEFQWVNETCKTTGLSQLNDLPISCVSDCSSKSCNNHITITNFTPSSASASISVEVGAKSPSNSGTTSDFRIYYYSEESDTTKVVEKYEGGALTIGSISYPDDFWVELPTQSINDREATIEEDGEIWIRFRSRVSLPAESGWYQVVFPQEFDIEDSQPFCKIVHGDMPFDNFPGKWQGNYQHTIIPNCNYKNRVLDVIFPGNINREFHGIESGRCTYLVLSTYGSGFRAPFTQGCYQLELYAKDNSITMETTFPEVCIKGKTIDSLSVAASTEDTSREAIYEIEFTTDYYIPPSYLYYEGTFPGEKSYIAVKFETHKSFAVDLGGNQDSNNNVNCLGVSGLPSELTCVLTQGSVTSSPKFTHDPAVVTISGYKSIPKNTQVKFHLPLIKNPSTDTWLPQLEVEVYKENFMGQKVWIYKETPALLDAVTASVASVASDLCSPSDCKSSSTLVLQRTNLVLLFTAQSANLDAGSKIIIKFPQSYQHIPSSGVTAYITKKGLANTATETYIVENIKVTNYPGARMVSLTIPSGKSVIQSEQCEIGLLNFVNPSYIDSGHSIEYYSIDSSKKVRDQYQTSDIFALFSLSPAKFKVSGVVFSSYLSESTGVQVQLDFKPKFTLEQRTFTYVHFPSGFPDISTLSPKAVCETNIQASCSIIANKVLIENYPEVQSGTLVKLKVFGVVNPSSGTFAFKVETLDANSKQVAYTEFPSVTIYEGSLSSSIGGSMTVNFLNAGVLAEYKFSLFSGKSLIKGTQVKVTFPYNYRIVWRNQVCAVEAITYTSCSILGNTVIVELAEDLPSYHTFGLLVSGVKNPPQMLTDQFQIEAQYSGQLVDQLDPNDDTFKVNIKEEPKTLVIDSYELKPNNEAEKGLYSFSIATSTSNIHSVFIRFPETYADHLLQPSANLVCSASVNFEKCLLEGNRLVKFHNLASFSYKLDVHIYGVTNPFQGQTGAFSIYLFDSLQNTITEYSHSVTFEITEVPRILNMTSVTASSSTSHSTADYYFNFECQLSDEEFWLEWPDEYQSLLEKSYFSCYFGNSSAFLDCNPVANTRKTVTSIVSTRSIQGEKSLKLTGLPTSEGYTSNFVLKVYSQKTLKSRSFANLTPNPFLYFESNTYRVYVNQTVVQVYRGAYSYPISVELEKPSFEELKFKPVPSTSLLGFSPPELLMQYASKDKDTFVVYAPMSLRTGNYSVTWQQTPTLNYQPLKEITVEVLDPAQDITVYCEEVPELPVSGTSFPIKVYLDKPSYNNLTLNFSTENPLQDKYVYFQPQSLSFEQGDQVKYFTVTLIEGAVTGSIKLSLSGDSSTSFKLFRNLIPFETITSDLTTPRIRSVRLHSIQRTSAEVLVQSSDSVKVHYMYSRKGTPPPTHSMLKSGEAPWSDVKVVYGTAWTKSHETTLSIEKLTDNTEYILYILVENRFGEASVEVKEFQFKTLVTPLPAKFRVYVTKATTPERICTAVAKALSLPVDWVLHTGSDPELGRRLTQDTSPYYELTLFVERSFGLDKPIHLVKQLDHKTNLLKELVPYYDSAHPLSEHATEYSYLKPEITNVQVESDDQGTLQANASISVEGTVYAVALPAYKQAPSSVQIRDGLDSNNLKVPRYSHQKVKYGEPAQLNFTGLPVHAEFVLYLTAENALPGNPQLIEDEFTKEVGFVVGTQLDTSFHFEFKNLNHAYLLCLGLLLLTLT